MAKTIRGAIVVISLLLIFFVAREVLAQWVPPACSPPGCNAPAPLDVSNVAQMKAGGLILNTGGARTGLVVAEGNVGIGTGSVVPDSNASLELGGSRSAVRGSLYLNRYFISGVPVKWEISAADSGAAPGLPNSELTSLNIGRPGAQSHIRLFNYSPTSVWRYGIEMNQPVGINASLGVRSINTDQIDIGRATSTSDSNLNIWGNIIANAHNLTSPTGFFYGNAGQGISAGYYTAAQITNFNSWKTAFPSEFGSVSGWTNINITRARTTNTVGSPFGCDDINMSAYPPDCTSSIYYAQASAPNFVYDLFTYYNGINYALAYTKFVKQPTGQGGGNLYLGGNADIRGDVRISSGLIVDYTASLNGGLRVNGDAIISRDLAVSRNVVGNLNLLDDLDVNGGATINGDLTLGNQLCLGTVCRSTWPGGGSSFWQTESGSSDIFYNGGNVGIGVTNPDRPLTIKGTGGNSEYISLRRSDNTESWLINNRVFGLNFEEPGGNPYVLFLQSGGNVGIGTPAPQSKLQVNGVVRATDYCDQNGNNCLMGGGGGGGFTFLATDNFLFNQQTCVNISYNYNLSAFGVPVGAKAVLLFAQVRSMHDVVTISAYGNGTPNVRILKHGQFGDDGSVTSGGQAIVPLGNTLNLNINTEVSQEAGHSQTYCNVALVGYYR